MFNLGIFLVGTNLDEESDDLGLFIEVANIVCKALINGSEAGAVAMVTVLTGFNLAYGG
jgi:hypothetical protein